MRLIHAMLAAAVAVLIGTLLWGAPAAAQTYPKLTGRVVDAANVLPAATKADLETKLQALERDTKRQLIVATIPDLQGRELPEYGVGLFRAWGVGLKGVDNGALLFIAPNEPKGHRGPYLTVGRGLEGILTDAYSGRMIRAEMMPKLTRSGDIPGAMEAGADAVIAQLRASPEEAKAETDAAAAEFDRTQRSARRGGGGGLPIGIVFFLFVAGFTILSLGRRAGGQRYRGGGGGGGGLGGGDSGLMPIILWGIASEIGRNSGGSGGWGGGSSDGGSSGWGGSDFGGGGGGDTGGGGASGSW